MDGSTTHNYMDSTNWNQWAVKGGGEHKVGMGWGGVDLEGVVDKYDQNALHACLKSSKNKNYFLKTKVGKQRVLQTPIIILSVLEHKHTERKVGMLIAIRRLSLLKTWIKSLHRV